MSNTATQAIEKFNEGWTDFCKHVNFGASNLTAENIEWMNTVDILMKKANAEIKGK